MGPSVLVRLNLPGFASPEPFRLGNAPASIAGLACAVLQEIGGFSQDELEAVRNHLDQVPLTLLGELCAGQLVELASDAELGVFLATAESPKGPPIIEVANSLRDVTRRHGSFERITGGAGAAASCFAFLRRQGASGAPAAAAGIAAEAATAAAATAAAAAAVRARGARGAHTRQRGTRDWKEEMAGPPMADELRSLQVT
ncbi:unnamed protein product [Cladocopium goreaui]|uniref:Uncharacterized protein n=1 Tax=Cladocopium goreaui TaxID=2562237 RepID=A0A9P1C576_9DINO|nr:unnamed protein product [Cladocopium goreaui]